MEKHHWFQQLLMAKQESRLKILEYLLYAALAIGLMIISIGQNKKVYEANFTSVVALVLVVFFGITFLFVDKYLDEKLGGVTNIKTDWAYPVLSVAFLVWALSYDLTLLKVYCQKNNFCAGIYGDLSPEGKEVLKNFYFFLKAALSSINSWAFLVAIKHLTFFSTNSTLRENSSFKVFIDGLSYKIIFRRTWTAIVSGFIIWFLVSVLVVTVPMAAMPPLFEAINWVQLPDLIYSFWVILMLLKALRIVLKEREFSIFIPVVNVALGITLVYQIINLFLANSTVASYLRPIGLVYQVVLAILFLAIGVTFVLKVGEKRKAYVSKVERFLLDFSMNNGFHKSNSRSIEQALKALAELINMPFDDFVEKFQIDREKTKNGGEEYKYSDEHAFVQTIKACFSDGKISLLMVLFTVMAALNDPDKKSSKKLQREIDAKVNKLITLLTEEKQIEMNDNVHGPIYVRDDLYQRYLNPDKHVNRDFEDISEILKLIFDLFSEVGFHDSSGICTLESVGFSSGKNELTFLIKGIDTEKLRTRLQEVQTKSTLPWRHIVSRRILKLNRKLNKYASAYIDPPTDDLDSIIKMFGHEIIEEGTLKITFKTYFMS
ncbi:MAG: hypothetical protein AAFZ15_15350 [Bacteroidota bacterium]